ncbi:MAG: hypothetical protein IPL47_03980 [Phyllobacteriaceae bacterium]|nr:hypothetical protein [Phyllobacteriaceae bacterium]
MAEPGKAERKPVVATVPRDLAFKLNYRLVPGRDFGVKARDPKCVPRGDRGPRGWDVGPIVSAALLGKLAMADKAVVGWLAKDPSHAASFIADPVAALAAAGVKLERAEQKQLARAREAVAETTMLPPGATLEAVGVSVHPKGRIGSLPSKGRDPVKADDFGCEPKRKG